MKENEKNSHYIVTTKTGRREIIEADRAVEGLKGSMEFFKGSEKVAVFNRDDWSFIVKGKVIETR